METVNSLITNIMAFIRKLFLLGLISIILSALVSVMAAGTAQAQAANTKKALAQLNLLRSSAVVIKVLFILF